MIHQHKSQSGFTAVELLITLFVAAAFLLAGYQLFNVVINDGGDTRAESRASNVGYDYLRRFSDSATNPCSPSTPMTNQPVTVEGLSDATVTVIITCPADDARSLSKIESVVNYGSPSKEVRYATFVDKSKGPTPSTDVTDGLVAWWPMNGNAQSNVGGYHLTNQGVNLTTGQNGQPDGAYAFTSTDPRLLIRDNFSAQMATLTAYTITGWVYPSYNPSNHENYFGIRDNVAGGVYILQLRDTNTLECRMMPTGTTQHQPSTLSVSANSWQMVTMVYTGSTLRCYVNNTSSTAVAANWSAFTAPNLPFYVGGNGNGHYMQGRIDDVRIYNRALSTTEINQLVTAGAK